MQRLLRNVLSFSMLALPLMASAATTATRQTVGYRVLSRVALGGEGGWDYLAFDPGTRHLFISRGDRVLVLNPQTLKVIGTIPDTAGVHGITIAPDLHRGFTSDGKSASVTEFDLGTLKTVATIHGTGENPDAIVYDAASHHVYTFNGKSHSASVIDPLRGAVIDTIPLPGKPEFAAADNAGRIYVNIEDTSELAEIDTIANKVLHVWPLKPCESPSGLALDNVHHRVFSVCQNRTMVVTDALDGHQVAQVPIGEGPDAVVFDSATAMIYSSNGHSGTITAVHEQTSDEYRVTATIPTQVSARTMALDPKTHRLYLSAARFEAKLQPNGWHTIVPDSFVVLVVGRH